ncbi:MAG: alpha/beta hydrolase [Planctomycetota bacterium]
MNENATLKPDVANFLETIRSAPPPPWESVSPEAARETFSSWGEMHCPHVDLERVADCAIHSVPVRVYHPQPSEQLPVIIFMHGGGWVLGDLETHDTLCRQLAVHSNCVVIAVDYPLSPGHRHPAALDACVAVTRGLRDGVLSQRYPELSFDFDRMAVAGDSAGGNLAMAVALKLRDAGESLLSHQLLFYPVVAPDFESESYIQFADGFGLTRESMKYFWKRYVGDSEPDEYANLLKNQTFSELPETLLVLPSADVLYSEGNLLAKRLESDGVAVTRFDVTGTVHGFVHIGGFFDHGLETLKQTAKQLGRKLRNE